MFVNNSCRAQNKMKRRTHSLRSHLVGSLPRKLQVLLMLTVQCGLMYQSVLAHANAREPSLIEECATVRRFSYRDFTRSSGDRSLTHIKSSDKYPVKGTKCLKLVGTKNWKRNLGKSKRKLSSNGTAPLVQVQFIWPSL